MATVEPRRRHGQGDSRFGFGDLPTDLTAALAVDALKKRSAAGEAARLAEWLTGRTTKAPILGPWL